MGRSVNVLPLAPKPLEPLRSFVEVNMSRIPEGGVIVVARDVTERWQQQVEAQQAEQLAAIGTLTTSIAPLSTHPALLL